MADLLDESIKEKYRQYFVNDPLKFMKDAIDWNAFPPLLKDMHWGSTKTEGKLPKFQQKIEKIRWGNRDSPVYLAELT